jgi:hypothetical protein
VKFFSQDVKLDQAGSNNCVHCGLLYRNVKYRVVKGALGFEPMTLQLNPIISQGPVSLRRLRGKITPMMVLNVLEKRAPKA